MNIRLEDKLVNYMHDHHKDTLMLKLIHDDYSGYDINSRHPSIRYHKPRHPENYNTHTVNDITVYVEKGIHAVDDELLFIDEKLLGIHRCHVVGVDLVTDQRIKDTYGPD